MTSISAIKFEGKDVIKLITLVFGFMTLYFNLKTEIHESKIVNNADKAIINFRLNTIEDVLKINKSVMGVATLPQNPERKNEDE